MAIRLSTGARTRLLQELAWRHMFNDCVGRIYTGSQPASADTGATGTLLCTITKASGTLSASTRQISSVTLTAAGTDTYTLVITVGTTDYTYTKVRVAEDATALAAALVALILAGTASQYVEATYAAGVIVLSAKNAGEAFTVANSGSSTPGNVVIAAVVANSRGNGLHWIDPVAGVIAKETAYAWSGVIASSGTAGYIRFSEYGDTPTDTSTTALRVDASIGTSGADCTVGSTTFTKDATATVDSASFTLPANA